MGKAATVVLGLSIPAVGPVFVAIVGVHVLCGLAAVVAGAAAMLSRKGRGRHSKLGTIYFYALAGLCASMSVLSAIRWDEDYHLFILGVLAFSAASFGRTAARRRWQQWPRLHLCGMGTSYILMLTAFYVDNGKSLPVWRYLPEIAFWLLPSAIGIPLILFALLKHPLLGRRGHRGAGIARSVG